MKDFKYCVGWVVLVTVTCGAGAGLDAGGVLEHKKSLAFFVEKRNAECVG